MRKAEIEFWALNLIDRVKSGSPVEDSHVELKSEWIPAEKAARRIAGHANAARGAHILWLIGVDEKKGPIGVASNDFADWYRSVQSHFDGVAPESTTVAFTHDGKTVVAIVFETDRAPYVVKNNAGGAIQFEVPWREGTALRSARRADLLRILVPVAKLPAVQVRRGTLRAFYESSKSVVDWRLEMELYAGTNVSSSVVFPFHQCSVNLSINDREQLMAFGAISMSPRKLNRGVYGARVVNPDAPKPPADSLTIAGTSTELIVSGPGLIVLEAKLVIPWDAPDFDGSVATIRANLLPVESELAVSLTTELKWQARAISGNIVGMWAL